MKMSDLRRFPSRHFEAGSLTPHQGQEEQLLYRNAYRYVATQHSDDRRVREQAQEIYGRTRDKNQIRGHSPGGGRGLGPNTRAGGDGLGGITWERAWNFTAPIYEQRFAVGIPVIVDSSLLLAILFAESTAPWAEAQLTAKCGEARDEHCQSRRSSHPPS